MAYDGAMRTLFVLACLALAACGAETTSSSADAGPDVAADAPAPPVDAPPAVDAASDVPAPCGGACWPGMACDGVRCVAVDAGPRCPADLTLCDEGCFDLRSSALHCGACGRPCRAGEFCLAGGCAHFVDGGVDAPADADPCAGACAELPYAPGSECVAVNTCAVRCAAGHADCDRLWTNGCETPLTTRENCGGCGIRCSGGRLCASGACR